MQRGIIEDMDHMQDIWNNMLGDKSQSLNVLISDYPLNPKEKKIDIAKVMFEGLKVQSLSIMNNAVLSLFSTGRTSGLVVESGQGVTYAVPIFEGYALPHAIQTINNAGQDVTYNLLESLINEGHSLYQNYTEFAREIKE